MMNILNHPDLFNILAYAIVGLLLLFWMFVISNRPKNSLNVLFTYTLLIMAVGFLGTALDYYLFDDVTFLTIITGLLLMIPVVGFYVAAEIILNGNDAWKYFPTNLFSLVYVVLCFISMVGFVLSYELGYYLTDLSIGYIILLAIYKFYKTYKNIHEIEIRRKILILISGLIIILIALVIDVGIFFLYQIESPFIFIIIGIGIIVSTTAFTKIPDRFINASEVG